jgi:ubiquinone biosynthesis protein
VLDIKEVPEQSGGFELLQERPPASLLSRFITTQRHILGLIAGGGFSYLRSKEAKGENYGILYWLLRILLTLARPFVDQRIISLPFPVQFRRRLELLGPTYIKLGQILSLREDLLPKSLTEELNNLLDRLPVVTFERYKELLEAELQRPVDSAFAWIDPLPIGSASLAQIHRARLLTQEEVVLKVLKPGVSSSIQQDCILLRSLATVLQLFLSRFQPRRLINEFASYTLREIDLRFEADNAETFAANFKDQSDIQFPKIYREYSSRELLCMEFFAGLKPSPAIVDQLSASERGKIIDLGVGSIMHMIFRHGFFHADLHPGNLIILPECRIGFIDLGMVGRIDGETRKAMLYYFVSLLMGDAVNAARTLTSIAVVGSGSNLNEFRREVAALNQRWMNSSTFAQFSIAQLILRSVLLAGRYRIYYPATIMLMLKALVTVEGVGNILDPQLDITIVARRHVRSIVINEFDPRQLIRRSLIMGPELFDLILRSPAILSESIQRLERQTEKFARSQQLLGLKMTLLAGFCLIAAAIIGVFGGHWLAWGGLTLLAIALALRGAQ